MKNTDFVSKVRKTIKDCSLFPKNAKILCAVSGGADSISLLSVLHELGEYELFAVHVNHCIRGEESDRDEDFVSSFCQNLQVPLHVERVDVPKIAKERGIGTEECARNLRYEIFGRAAEKFGAEYIATAHNANDNLETAIFNLLRGTGTAGLAGIPTVRLLGKYRVVRPLLCCPRTEIEAYLSANGIKYVVDSTNLGNDYARNRIRHEILPKLEELNPELYETVPASQKLLRSEAEFIADESEKAYQRIADGSKCSKDELLALPAALRGRVIARFYKAAGGREDLSMANCEAVCRAAASEKPSAYAELPGNIIAAREYGFLVFRKVLKKVRPEGVLELDSKNTFPGMTIELSQSERPEKFGDKYTFYIDRAKIQGKLSVRTRQEGDTIALAGHNNRKTLKKLMIDLKIPREHRDFLPVICDEQGIIAVGGIGVDERVRIDKSTDNIEKVDIEFTEDM